MSWVLEDCLSHSNPIIHGISIMHRSAVRLYRFKGMGLASHKKPIIHYVRKHLEKSNPNKK